MAAKGNFAQPFTDYEILERLGSGGMGTVFKARYRGKPDGPDATLQPDQIVALKVLRPSLGRNERYRERLRREAQMSMQLEHENLVKGFALGEEAGYHYLVMEFCEGPSLRQLLRMWGCFPEDLVLRVGVQIASALGHAHEHGIVHRDVKPANILVDDDGRAVLTDLGLAKGDTDLALTRDGATVGTPQYMSPEQAMNPSDVDARSDLYSLGATLYHMSTGSAPFDGSSVGHVILKILRQRARPAHEINPELDPGLSLVLRKLLEKDIEVRYQKASQLLADLHRLQRGEQPKIDIKALERAEGRQNRRRLRQRVPIAVLGALVVVLSVFLLFQQFGADPDNGDAPVSGIVKLREHVERYIRGGGRQYRSAFKVLDEFEATDPSSVVAKVNLASQLRSSFESSLTDFLVLLDQKMFEGWFFSEPDKQDAWDTSFLGIDVTRQLVAWYGYAPEALPAGRGIFANWKQQRREGFARDVKSWGRKLVREYETAFEEIEVPRIASLLAEGRYDEASKRLVSLAADPGLCQPQPKSRLKRLLTSQEPLLARLERQIAAEHEGVVDAANRAVEDWSHRLRGRLDLARADAERNDFDKAKAGLDAAKNSLESPPTGLPARIRIPREQLLREVGQARAYLQTTIYNSDLASLEHLEDVTHSLLFALDVGGALELLKENPLHNQDLAARQKRLVREVELFEKTLVWILATLHKHGKKAKVWRPHSGGSSVQGRLTRVVESPEPTLELKEAGVVNSYPLAAFDRLDIVDKLREWDRAGHEAHRAGLALFLYFGDKFDSATRLMTRPDTEFAERRARRRRRLADERSGQQRVIESDLARAERFVDSGKFEFAQRMLDGLDRDYQGTRALTSVRQRISTIERRLALESLRTELIARLPEKLRREIDLGLSSQGDGSAQLGLSFDFAHPDRFVDRFGTRWQKARTGLRRSGPPDAAREIKDAIELKLPVFDEKQEAGLVLDFTIPRVGRSLDVVAISYQGTRVLLYQVPGAAERPGRSVAVESSRRLTKAIEKDLADANRKPRSAPVWYFVNGASYRLRLRLGKVELGRRILTVELGGTKLLETKVKGRIQPAPVTFGIVVVGGMLVEHLELTGSPRQ